MQFRPQGLRHAGCLTPWGHEVSSHDPVTATLEVVALMHIWAAGYVDYDDGTPPVPDTSVQDPLVVSHTYATTGTSVRSLDVGTYTLMVTATNYTASVVVTDTHTIAVSRGFYTYLPIVVGGG